MFTIVQLLKLGSGVDGHFWIKDDDGDNNFYINYFLKKVLNSHLKVKRIKELKQILKNR